MPVRDQIYAGCHPSLLLGELRSYSDGIAVASEGVSRERSQ